MFQLQNLLLEQGVFLLLFLGLLLLFFGHRLVDLNAVLKVAHCAFEGLDVGVVFFYFLIF